MCVALLAIHQNATYPFILIHNRDEFYNRPSEDAAYRGDHKEVLAGLDGKESGYWLGLNRTNGRIAFVTNYRDPKLHREDRWSRGALVKRFLLSPLKVEEFGDFLARNSDKYNPFNLFYSDLQHHQIFSSQRRELLPLSAGVYGLSNAFLDTPWFKVERAKQLFREKGRSINLSPQELSDLFLDEERPDDALLPKTGIPLEVERVISSIFIRSAEYGTRSTTVIMISADQKALFYERSFLPNSKEFSSQLFNLSLTDDGSNEGTMR